MRSDGVAQREVAVGVGVGEWVPLDAEPECALVGMPSD